jgi:hypothetical protein
VVVLGLLLLLLLLVLGLLLGWRRPWCLRCTWQQRHVALLQLALC